MFPCYMFQYSFPTGRMQFYLGLVLISGAGLGGFSQPLFNSLSTSSHSHTHLLFCREHLMFPGNSVQTQQAGSPQGLPFPTNKGPKSFLYGNSGAACPCTHLLQETVSFSPSTFLWCPQKYNAGSAQCRLAMNICSWACCWSGQLWPS